MTRFALALATAILVLGAAAPRARAQSAVSCTATEIVASNTNDKKGVGPGLERFKAKLSKPPFAGYDSFALLSEQTFSAELNKSAAVGLKNGKLSVLFQGVQTAKGGKPRLRCGVTLDDSAGKRVVTTVIVFDSGDHVLWSGSPVQGGTYILALGCTAP